LKIILVNCSVAHRYYINIAIIILEIFGLVLFSAEQVPTRIEVIFQPKMKCLLSFTLVPKNLTDSFLSAKHTHKHTQNELLRSKKDAKVDK